MLTKLVNVKEANKQAKIYVTGPVKVVDPAHLFFMFIVGLCMT